MSRVVRAFLGVGASLAIPIGLTLVVAPGPFRAFSGNATPTLAGELSEIRAPGGAVLAIGLLMVLGVFRSGLQRLALGASAATFLGYAFGRLVSFGLDGMPSIDLAIAGLVEFGLGAGGLALFARRTAELEPNE